MGQSIEDGFRELLQILDNIVGTGYGELKVLRSPEDALMVAITSKCRVCDYEAAHGGNMRDPDFSTNMVRGFVARCEAHSRNHQIIIPNAAGG